MFKKNPYPGKLVIVEGIDGSGKSTQINLLYKWLNAQGKSVYYSEWNSSELVKSTMRLGKRQKMFTPTTYSLLQATDFADRWENLMLPLLKAGVIVLADRYAFTGLARDVARGLDIKWVRNLYSFALQPDLALYFKLPLDVALQRLISARAKIKFYEAGMDLGLSENRLVSFRLFQQRVIDEYEHMAEEFNFTILDGTLPVQTQQQQIRNFLKKTLLRWEGLPNPRSLAKLNRGKRFETVSETGGVGEQKERLV